MAITKAISSRIRVGCGTHPLLDDAAPDSACSVNPQKLAMRLIGPSPCISAVQHQASIKYTHLPLVQLLTPTYAVMARPFHLVLSGCAAPRQWHAHVRSVGSGSAVARPQQPLTRPAYKLVHLEAPWMPHPFCLRHHGAAAVSPSRGQTPYLPTHQCPHARIHDGWHLVVRDWVRRVAMSHMHPRHQQSGQGRLWHPPTPPPG
jgi:hypothetical protein